MKFITYQVINRIGYITLNRPEKRNALNYELISELKAAFTQAEGDLQVKVIVLKALGEAFCSGADLGYLQQLQHFSLEENIHDSNHLKELFQLIYTLKKVVIAQVQGHAVAGGCGLAVVCDFVFAVPEAKFGYTEVRIGFVPAIVMYFLLKKIGEGKSKHLLLSGELIEAKAALDFGMINQIVEANKLALTVQTFAQRLIEKNSSQSMEITKKMISEIQSLPFEEALQYASLMNANARSTDDCKRGVASFLDKTKLIW